MKNFVIAAVAAFALTAGVFAGEKPQAVAAAVVAKEACACNTQVVEVSRPRLLGRRNAACCCETCLVPTTKTVTTYETKKILVEKEVKVPVKKEVTVLAPVKAAPAKVAAPVCGTCATTVAAPVRRLGGRLRGATVAAVDCVSCK